MCDKNKLNEIMAEVTKRAQKLLGKRLRNVILYGSYARGDYDDESDIDIMILADGKDDEIRAFEYDLDIISSRVSLEHNITVCILLNDKNLFEQRMPLSMFYRNVINDGVQFYVQ